MSEKSRNPLLNPDDISEIQKILQEIDSIGIVTKTRVEDIVANSNKNDSSE
jgi:hypothetical protein